MASIPEAITIIEKAQGDVVYLLTSTGFKRNVLRGSVRTCLSCAPFPNVKNLDRFLRLMVNKMQRG